MQESEKETIEKESVIIPVPGTNMKESQSLSVTGLLYSKEEWKQKVESDVMHRVTGDERTELIAFAKKQWNIEKADLPEWVMPALRLRKEGKSVILGIKRFSMRTSKIAPIFNAILVSYDIRHNETKDVKGDYGIQKDHSGPNDILLRHRVMGYLQNIPIFVQLEQQEKNWRTLIRDNDGKMLTVHCENNVLLIYFQGMETPVTFFVKTLKQ